MNIDPLNLSSSLDLKRSIKEPNKLSLAIKHVALPLILGGAGFSLACGLIAYGYRVTGVTTVTCSVIASAVATVFNYPKDYSNQKLQNEIVKILYEGNLEEFAAAAGNKFEIDDLNEAGFLTKEQETHIKLTYQDYKALVQELTSFWSCNSREKSEIQSEIEDLKNSWKYYQDGELRHSLTMRAQGPFKLDA